jgi:hypothetical protein
MKNVLSFSQKVFIKLLLFLFLGQIALGAPWKDDEAPQGSTCENPIIVDIFDAPLTDFQINSEAYGDNYSSTMVTPTHNYLNGNDVVFQFTLPGKSQVNAGIYGSWAGLVLVSSCPDADNPPASVATTGGSSGGSISHILDEGTYFLIAGTWPSPQYTDMTINLTASLIPLDPLLVSTTEELYLGKVLSGQGQNSASVSFTNLGVETAVIQESDLEISGQDADAFSVFLAEGTEFPLEIGFQESKSLNILFAPQQEGIHDAVLEVSWNHPDDESIQILLTGEGYLPLTNFYNDFSGATPPALPSPWSGILQSTSTAAALNISTSFGPKFSPNHVNMYNGNDVSATIILVSPAVTDLENSRVHLWAKMGATTHTGALEIGFLTDPNDADTFITLDTLQIDGTYKLYDLEIAGFAQKDDNRDILFPENAYLGFRHIPNATFRRMLLDGITYEPMPEGPVADINKDLVDFGDMIWYGETVSENLVISNTGSGILSLEETDFQITGDDADAFELLFNEDQEWPLELAFGQSFGFDVSFSPLEVRPYSATLVIENQNSQQDDLTVSLSGSGHDPTITPHFTYDFIGDFPPTDWRRYIGMLTDDSDISLVTTAIWTHGRFANTGEELNSAYIRIFGTTRNHWLVTPPIDLGDEETKYQLEFDLALTAFNSTNPSSLGAPQRFVVLISTDNGVTWSENNILRSWTQGDDISNTGEKVILDLAEYTGVIRIAFYGESTATSSSPDLFVTNVSVVDRTSGILTFDVKDEEGDAITDATITLNGEEFAPGQYVFDLIPGTYNYIVSRDDYYDAMGSLQMNTVDLTHEVVLELVPPFYPVNFTVTHEDTPLQGAMIRVFDNEGTPYTDDLITDENGHVQIEAETGEYSYEVTKTGYVSITDGSFTVTNEPVDIDISLQLPAPLALPFMEDFNESVIPDYWLIQDQEDHAASNTWMVYETISNNSLNDTPFLAINSDIAGSNTILNSMAITPAINATGYEGLLALSFEHFFNKFGQNEEGKVDIWDGQEWQNVAHFTSDQGSWANPAQEKINIDAYANDELRVRFHYNDNGEWGWYWAVDNIVVQGVPAYSVTFNVTDEEGTPVENAVITFDGNEFPAGQYVVDDLFPGSYSYTVEKEDYFPLSGEVSVVDENVIVNVALEQIPPPTFTVTFEVEDENGNAISDAAIIFDGDELDPGVYVVEEVLAGEYPFTVSREGYITWVSTIEVVDEDVTVAVILEAIPLYTITFAIEDEEGNAIADATVTFDGEQFPAGEYVVEDIPEGTYDYTVSKEGYYDVDGQVTITEEDITLNIVMQLLPEPVFTLTFVVEDEDGVAITDAVVTFDGDELAAGEYVIEDLPAGVYDYSINREGYYEITGEATVIDEDLTVNVVMLAIPEPTYTITFEVEDEEGNAINDAVITFEGEELPAGEYVVEDLLAGTYTYTVAREGYYEVNGETTIEDDITITVVMWAIPDPTYSVTFIIEDEDGNSITDALITFNGAELPAGEYVITDLEPGTYSYLIQREGYHEKSDEVVVSDEDVTIHITLELITHVGDIFEAGMNIYPNPAHRYVNIELSNATGKIDILLLNTNGQIVKTISENDHTGMAPIRIDTGDLSPGIYLVRVLSGSNVITHQLIIQ